MRYKQGFKSKRIGDKVYHTQRWRKLRQYKYDKEHGICQQCGEPGDIVDHVEEITPDNVDNPNITFNVKNLKLLCLSCHNKKTFKKHYPVREGMGFDAEGNLIQLK